MEAKNIAERHGSYVSSSDIAAITAAHEAIGHAALGAGHPGDIVRIPAYGSRGRWRNDEGRYNDVDYLGKPNIMNKGEDLIYGDPRTKKFLPSDLKIVQSKFNKTLF